MREVVARLGPAQIAIINGGAARLPYLDGELTLGSDGVARAGLADRLSLPGPGRPVEIASDATGRVRTNRRGRAA